jgi:hypothetical protein
LGEKGRERLVLRRAHPAGKFSTGRIPANREEMGQSEKCFD